MKSGPDTKEQYSTMIEKLKLAVSSTEVKCVNVVTDSLS